MQRPYVLSMNRNWRALFDEIHIPWRDRGKNTSRGNINVCCPLCQNDDGFHMGISETKNAYYCFRNPRHSGTNVIGLLCLLGVSRSRAIGLLNAYKSSARYIAPVRKESLSDVESKWRQFFAASESARCVDYLERDREIPNALHVCRRYDLRYAREGKWANRLLIPIRVNDVVVSWTGRAIRSSLLPKYYMMPGSVDSLIYMPRPARKHLIIVEGPLDALKGAIATEHLDVSFLALLGKNLSYDRMFRIKQACVKTETIYLSLDNSSDVFITHTYQYINALAAHFNNCYVSRMRIPAVYKDVAEMSLSAIADWVTSGGILTYAKTEARAGSDQD